MNNTQIETFKKIAETGNFTSAANALGYAQSTVTTQIRQLEEELDCLLFERLGKTIVLTDAGERMLFYADKMLQLEREVFLEVPGSGEPSGIFQLGVSESLCYDRLPGLLMTYRERFPKVDIRIRFVMHDSFAEQLNRGELDLVYTLNPRIRDERLRLLYEKREKLAFYASPFHTLAKKKKLCEEDLKGVDLLLTSHNCSFRHMLLKDLEQKGIMPKIAMETGSKEILKQFAAKGLGVAFMPEMAALEEVRKKTLVKLKWSGEDFPVYSQIFIHKDKQMNSVISEFMKLAGNM